MATLERTPVPIRRGSRVVVHEPNIADRYGDVMSVKWSKETGWWVDVRDDEGFVRTHHESLVEQVR